jgi:hypothetical protein
MGTAKGDMGSQVGIRALANGVQIGNKFRIYVGDGSPAAVFTATEIGDLYLDYTNGVLYIASATGTGSWTAYAGLSSMTTGTLAGTTTVTGTMNVGSGATLAIAGTLTVTGTAGLSNATLTIPSGATLSVAGTSTISGTTTITGTMNVNITPTIVGVQGTAGTASPLSYKVMTMGGTGATPVSLYTLYGAPSAAGPTPPVAGCVLIDTKNGKMYLSSAATAWTDWKLVTSA